MVPTALGFEDKNVLHTRLRKQNSEGIVFKDMHATIVSGRPASGGSQLKFKLVQTASFIVLVANVRRSVRLGLIGGGGDLVPAGNVTIATSHDVPSTGAIVEVRYLYALRQSGSVYQPVYLGERNDIDPLESVVSQLNFRPDQEASEAA